MYLFIRIAKNLVVGKQVESWGKTVNSVTRLGSIYKRHCTHRQPHEKKTAIVTRTKISVIMPTWRRNFLRLNPKVSVGR